MNAAANPKVLHTAYIGLGSNIEPETNMVHALSALRQKTRVACVSSVWRAPALGTNGPDFLNAVVKVETSLSESTLKAQVLRPIEARLGRQRSQDKNTPRTIDLDVLVFDDVVVDVHVWDYAHLAVPLAECLPTLMRPSNNQRIEEIAQDLQKINKIQKTDLFSKVTP